LFRAAAERWVAEVPAARTSGGADWRRQVLRRVSRELGSVPVADFAGTALRDYDARNKQAGNAPRTRRNLLSIAAAVVRHCGIAPVVPRVLIATAAPPSYAWLTEADMRDLRVELFRVRTGGASAYAARHGESPATYADRRRLFVSIAYYTGLHTSDVERFSGADVYCDPAVGTWRRHNAKSSRVVPDAQLPLPQQLAIDLADFLRATGRRRFEPAELIAGGPWTKATKSMTAAAKRLGLPPLNFRLFRRSCVYELALRNWSERDCAEYLGHVDQRMIREVYARWPLGPLVAPVRRMWNVQSSVELWHRRAGTDATQITTGTAQIIRFPGHSQVTKTA